MAIWKRETALTLPDNALDKLPVAAPEHSTEQRLVELEKQMLELKHATGLLLDYINKKVKFNPPRAGYYELVDKD